jgi:pimeloyl-ACP methyl ester carboxylesterase
VAQLERVKITSGPVFEGMSEHWIAIDGLRLRYLAGGSGAPLLLVHGIAGFSFSWRKNFSHLIGQFRVLAPDLPGVGYSERSDKLDASIPGMARILFRFLDAVQINSAHIVGSSHGGAVVMEMAAQQPERIRSMVLVAPVNPYAEKYQGRIRFMSSSIGQLFMKLAPWMAVPIQRYAIARMYGDRNKMPTGTAEGYCKPLRIAGTIPHLLRCFQSWPGDIQNLQSKFDRMSDVPTLFIWGERDGAVELQSGEKLRNHFHDAQLVILPGAGHLPYEEAPEEFNRALVSYLASRQARRPQPA